MVAHVGTIDQDQRSAAKRSLDIGAAGTVLLQTVISKTVQMITNNHLGIQSTLPVKPGSGDGWYSNRRSAATTGAAHVNDTEEPVESEGAYTQAKFPFATLLGRIKVTRKLVKQGRSYGDILATELIGKAEDFAFVKEQASVTGDRAADPKGINGLLTLVGAVSGQTVANTSNPSGDALVIDKLDATLQRVKGVTNRAAMRIYCNLRGHRLLNNALQAQQRFLSDGFEIEGGFVVSSYNGMPVIESDGIPDTLVWDGTSITAFTGGTTTAFIAVNTSYVFYAELTPMTVQPLAKKSSQYDEIDLYTDYTLVLDNPLGAAILGGLGG